MHVVVVDSGLGGLSITGMVTEFFEQTPLTEPLRLTYLNLALSNEQGYNQISDPAQQLLSFQKSLLGF